jgi:hypothetical protein
VRTSDTRAAVPPWIEVQSGQLLVVADAIQGPGAVAPDASQSGISPADLWWR